jgi:dolichol kinase
LGFNIGTAAFVIGLFMAFKLLTMGVGVVIDSHFKLLLICLQTGLLEAFSEQNDNICIPLYLAGLLNKNRFFI